jgi:hypothetical protein
VHRAEQNTSVDADQGQRPCTKHQRCGASEKPGSTTKTHIGSTVIDLVSSSPPRRRTTTPSQHIDEETESTNIDHADNGSTDLYVIQTQITRSTVTEFGPSNPACRKAVYDNHGVRQTIADLVWQLLQPLCPRLRPWKWNERIQFTNDKSVWGTECQYNAESFGASKPLFLSPVLHCTACGIRHSISITMPACIALGIGSLSRSQWCAIFDGEYSLSSIVVRCASTNQWSQINLRLRIYAATTPAATIPTSFSSLG